MSKSTAIELYDKNAAEVSRRFEKLDAFQLNAWFVHRLPEPPAMVLDVGAGSGRDAAWFCQMGYEVTAIEPSLGMRTEAVKYHGKESIKWIEDSLPNLQSQVNMTNYYDMILLSAVWMHLVPDDRSTALAMLSRILKKPGSLLISLRIGETDIERNVYDVSLDEIDSLCHFNGLTIVSNERTKDQLGRDEIEWINIILEKM